MRRIIQRIVCEKKISSSFFSVERKSSPRLCSVSSIIADPYVTSPPTYLQHRPNDGRNELVLSHNLSHNLEDSDASEPRLRHVGRLKVGSNEGSFPDIPGYVYLVEHGRASDGGRKQAGSPRDRNLSTCSTSCTPPLSTRGNLPLLPLGQLRDTRFSILFRASLHA